MKASGTWWSQRHSKFLLIVGVGAVIGFAAWQALSTREPSYKGKTLSYWLGGDDPPHGLLSETEEKEAKVAIRTMGPKCAPFLTRMIGKYSPVPEISPKWTVLYSHYRRSRVERWFDKRYTDVFHARERAESAFEILGCRGAPAVPDLIRLLEHKNEEIRTSAAKVLAFIGPGAEQAVPALTKHLNDVWVPRQARDQSYYDAISFWCAQALESIPHPPAQEVPALIENLKKPAHARSTQMCLSRLARAGEAARVATPVVKTFLNDPDTDVRISARNCLQAFTPSGVSPSTTP